MDFDYVGKYGLTIYCQCFQRYINARFSYKRTMLDVKIYNEWKNLVIKTEIVFDFLIEEGNKHRFDVDKILEIPDSTGATCFSIASQFSKKISEYIIGRRIKINSITLNMMVPDFYFSDLAVPMMEKGINPLVFSYSGHSAADGHPTSFINENAKQLMAQFPRSSHFSIEDIHCPVGCSPDCSSKFERFYFKNGEFVKMNDENRIGQGGFGCVFKGSFHGENKALKCVFIGRIQQRDNLEDSVSDAEQNISEIRIQMASGGSGVLVPEAFVRQQNQEQDEIGDWRAENYNVYIYPLYDCNLYELHENYYGQFNDEILKNVLCQCLTRKSSYRVYDR